MTALPIVDVETARDARGLRLVIVSDVPSPWSQAAKTVIEMKRIPALLVRKSARDTTVQGWTGIANAPVAIYDDEPPRSGWAEILELTERIEPRISLVPKDSEMRATMFGLSHELLGAGGLMWSARLFTIEASLASSGARGFALPIAEYLAARYGYAQGCGDAAKVRAIEILAHLRSRLQRARREGHPYYLGATPTALDVYSAAVMNALVQLPPDQCPTHPARRRGFEHMGAELAEAIAPELIEHRDHMVAQHFQVPLQL